MKTSLLNNLVFVIIFAVTVPVVTSAYAATTVLTFDGYANGTIITNQYPGVTFSGAGVWDCSTEICGGFTVPVSGTNVVVDYFPTGIISVSFDETIIGGPVTSVSAYVTGFASAITIAAYDASGNLISSAKTDGPNYVGSTFQPNMLLTVSSTIPIAAVQILKHSSYYSWFSVDNFSYSWIETCAILTENLSTTISGIPLADFVSQTTAADDKNVLIKFAADIDKMVEQNMKRTNIEKKLLELRVLVNFYLHTGTDRTSVLAAIDGVSSQIRACK